MSPNDIYIQNQRSPATKILFFYDYKFCLLHSNKNIGTNGYQTFRVPWKQHIFHATLDLFCFVESHNGLCICINNQCIQDAEVIQESVFYSTWKGANFMFTDNKRNSDQTNKTILFNERDYFST